MKRHHLLVLLLVVLFSKTAHAQWTASGDDIYNNNIGNVVIGRTSPITINASAALFPSVIPKFSIAGTGTAPYTDLITLSHPVVTVDAVQRQAGFILKLSGEGNTAESNKMGGLLLESNSAWANNPSLSLVAGNVRRLTINYNGYVGIGTTTPTSSLEVNGTGRFTGSNPNAATGAGVEVFYYPTSGGYFQAYDRAAATFLPVNIQGSSINFSNSGTASTNPALTITGGSVGIGTPAPVSTFQINSNSTKLSAGSAGSSSIFYGTSYVGFNAARNGSTANWTIDGDSAHNGGGVIYGDIFGNIYMAPIASAGTSQRTLTDLDIKSNITFKVGNNGTVYAKAVSVQTTGWPDYVFKKNYKLPELNSVKQFISQNQHLPEMPSAMQIEKDGQNLGEMNKLLLKKVEELTLYLIDLKSEMKEKDDQLRSLQKRVSQLEKPVSNK